VLARILADDRPQQAVDRIENRAPEPKSAPKW
jgi:hypothetical protein